MYQVLGAKFMISLAAWAAISLFALFNIIGLPMALQVTIGLVNFLLIVVILSNDVWRWIWNKTGPLGRWLSHSVYPDLNGTYDVMLESNWPIVNRMLEASKQEAEPFDPFDRQQEPPALMTVELEACIEQTWFDITMWMYPKSSEPSNSVLDSSKTLATIPLRGSGTSENELIYIFKQKNDIRLPTDDPYFEGAARLKIDHADPKILRGEYWNNRVWQRGLNVAGRLEMRRRSSEPVHRAGSSWAKRNASAPTS